MVACPKVRIKEIVNWSHEEKISKHLAHLTIRAFKVKRIRTKDPFHKIKLALSMAKVDT